ncbi:hypothetical protein [Micavibrio aeruginosavorus]|uniref:Uncharacterized protein n=1 Tax=Micavibrio aeruginosavorus EPB TaxID=349215 RepID=M4VGC6_9BACT|nr:hypothetical protein [Micavibrio aeruginosavorus]AGH97515.1 hypothetical protein A11S_691 [Micavibrio aeruginosavorus EPB]
MQVHKRQLKGVFVIALLCVLIFSPAAHAHRPYLVNKGTLTDPGGEIIVKGKRYGDGIFSTDPVTFEIRNRNGVVLANTPVADHVAVFCPHAKFCWAFPYGYLTPIVSGYKLDADNIDWDAQSKNDSGRGNFERYLSGDEKTLRDYDLDYPEFIKTYSGFEEVKMASIISPIMIVFDQFFILLGLLVLTFVPYLLYWLFFSKRWTQNKVLKYGIFLFGSCIFLGYCGFYFLALLVFGYTLSTPIFYLLAAIISGAVLGALFSKKTKRSALVE